MYKGKVNIVSKLKRGDLELVIDVIKKADLYVQGGKHTSKTLKWLKN
jgi:hypothetical protein